MIDIIIIVVWFVALGLQYAFAYGLWKPRRWARKVGITSLGLGVAVSATRLLGTIAVFTALQQDVPGSIARPGIIDVAWDAVVFSVAFWFLNKPEVRDYIEAEGHGYAEPTPLVVEEEMEPEPAPPEEVELELAAPISQVEPEVGIPDAIKGKRPESVARVAEEKCLGEIFLDEDHLIIVKSPDEPVIDIPIENIMKLERGTMRSIDRFTRGELAAEILVRGRRLGPLMLEKIPTVKITYSRKSGQMSTVTLVAEQKICPKCGRKMLLVAAGWYCMKDDFLVDPATNDLAQLIESRRSQKKSRIDVG